MDCYKREEISSISSHNFSSLFLLSMNLFTTQKFIAVIIFFFVIDFVAGLGIFFPVSNH